MRRDRRGHPLTTAARPVRPADHADSGEPDEPAWSELLVQLDDDGGEALAAAVRALPHTPWLTVLDAYVQAGRVVLVLPATDRSLGEALRDGLDRDVAEVLLWSFDETLHLLEEQGLAPAALDPDAVGLTPSGDVLLLPATGPAPPEAEREAELLLAALRAADGAPGAALVPRAAPVVRTAEAAPVESPTAPVPAPTPSRPSTVLPPVVEEVVERPAVRPTPRPRQVGRLEGRSSAATWGRTVLLSALAAVTVLAVGFLLTDRDPAPRRSSASSEAAQTSGAAATSPGGGLDALVQDLSREPSLAGGASRALLGQLQQVQTAEGPRRAAAAAAALQTVAASPPDDAAVLRRIRAVVRPIAQPADLAGLTALLRVDPTAPGTDGPEVLSRLVALQALPASELARTKAQDLAAFVASRAVLGGLSPTFADIAGDVLRPLAQPADLPALLRAVRVQPERFGPGTPGVIGRLDQLGRLRGDAARSEAAALLAAIDAQVAGGTVTKAFQDIAAPVLRPIAMTTATGDAR